MPIIGQLLGNSNRYMNSMNSKVLKKCYALLDLILEGSVDVPEYPKSSAPVSSETNGSEGGKASGAATPDQWERGDINYTGSDRFHNIQRHLDAMIYKNANYY